MADKLTDEQVAALVDIKVEATNEYAVEFSAPLHDDLNVEATVQSLALEVQQSRARRCDRCAWWLTPATCGNYPYGECDLLGGICDGKATAPDFFCADFTPQEGR